MFIICEVTEELDDTERGEGGLDQELGTNGFGWLNRT